MKEGGNRCAKNALSLIGSPALKFEPDNDTDDYTSVTAYINEEFAKVKAEEEGVKDVIETTGKTTDKTTLKTDEKKLILIKEHPDITQAEIASQPDITVDGVRYQIDKMKKSGIIKRVGGKKSGCWEITP